MKSKIQIFSTVLLICCNILIGMANNDTIPRKINVTLNEAHIGNAEIDKKLLNSFGQVPDNIERFYLQARKYFVENKTANYTDSGIVNAAQKNKLLLMGGPMLGNLKSNGVNIWLRPVTKAVITVKLSAANGNSEKEVQIKDPQPGKKEVLKVSGLKAQTSYNYKVLVGDKKVAEGNFSTAPEEKTATEFKVAFGSCFHKIGLHNPNLVEQIINRKPDAMLLLGDIAVDDRENQINMHRSDYLLRDVSAPWQKLAANTPLYATWDDHDYLNNDLSGLDKNRFANEDRDALRTLWEQNWNNPTNKKDGIFFNTRIGPVEVFMLDTRSCRDNSKRGEYGSYLGMEQMNWLKKALKKSDAPFKIISSGTMWSDYVTKAKDSWGSWDTEAREELFSLIVDENISGVLLISGDRHGARGFTIPVDNSNELYEFEAGSLGGVPGPPAMAEDDSHQLFGYHGLDTIAFGEFSFNTKKQKSEVTFRLIDQYGKILEEYIISHKELTPVK